MASEEQERPFRDHSEREILDGIRHAQKEQRHWAKGDSGEQFVLDQFSYHHTREQQLSYELEARRRDRAAAREAQSDRSGSGSGGGAYGAIKAWLQAMGESPNARIYHTWESSGRQFYATYSRQNQSLKVWAQVLPSTPGASTIGSISVMPANNRHELNKAIDAEKSTRL